MNIFKTFETFLKEPLSILRDNFIQIVSVQTGNIFAEKPSVDVSVMKDKNCINFCLLLIKKRLKIKMKIIKKRLKFKR